MKPILNMALFMLLSSSLVLTAHAGTMTTTTTTTVTTVKRISCPVHHKHHKKHSSARHHRSSVSYMDTFWYRDCPGNDCYYDVSGHRFQSTALPIRYGDETRFQCVSEDNGSSCG